MLNAGQAYVAEILGGPAALDAGVRARCGRPTGASCARASVLRNPELADALELLAREGAEPFYRGEIAEARERLARARAAAC